MVIEMVKRLNEDKKKHVINNSEDKKSYQCTPIVFDRQEAVEAKLKQLHGSIFGKPIIKFEVGHMRDVWVPYEYIVFSYAVGGEKGVLKMARKTGETAVVFDKNERHCFQYDVYEKGHLLLKNISQEKMRGTIIKSDISKKEVKELAEDYVQHKVMRRSYGQQGKLILKRQIAFYRPAVEIEVIYRGKNKNIRFAYLDEYGIESEHVTGMKYRLDHK